MYKIKPISRSIDPKINSKINSNPLETKNPRKISLRKLNKINNLIKQIGQQQILDKINNYPKPICRISDHKINNKIN